MNCNTAIFYDLENITGLLGKDSETFLSKIRQAVEQRLGQGTISIQRAYADWNRFQSKDLANSMLVWGVSPVHVFNTNNCDKLKNASDVCMIIDALDIAFNKPYIENFVIVSGDGIFTLLINKLHEMGKMIIGLGYPITSNALFVKSCDEFVDLGSLDTVTDIIEVKESLMNNKVVRKLPPNFPNNQLSLSLLNSGLSPVSVLKSSDSEILNAVKTMTKLIFTYKDTINLSLYHFYLNHFIQKFRTSRFGMKHLKDFVSFVLYKSPYCLYTADSAIMLTKRELADIPGNIIEPSQLIQFQMSDGSIKESLFDIDDDASFTLIREAAEPKQIPQKTKKRRSKNTIKQPQKAHNSSIKDIDNHIVDELTSEQITEALLETETELAQEYFDGEDDIPDFDMYVDLSVADESVHEESREDLNYAIHTDDVCHESDNQQESNQAGTDFSEVIHDKPMFGLVEQIGLFDGGDMSGGGEAPAGMTIKRLVKVIFNKLMEDNLLTEAEILNLTKKEYCERVFSTKYPILKRVDETINIRSQRLENGRPIYWLHLLDLGIGKFYLFKEWNEVKSGKKLQEWYHVVSGGGIKHTASELSR